MRLRKADMAGSGESNDLSYDEQLKNAKKNAMNLLKARDYTEARLRLKLRDRGFSEEIIDGAVEYVKSFGYIDDLRYARNFVRTSSGTRSRRETERKLMERGVSSDVINEAFESESTGSDEEAEDELIKKLILKRCPHPEELDHKGRSKLFAYMYGKGFSIDRVQRMLEVLLDITS